MIDTFIRHIAPYIVIVTPFVIWFFTWRSNRNIEKLKSKLQSNLDQESKLVEYLTNSMGAFRGFVSEKEICAINKFWDFYVELYTFHHSLASIMCTIKIDKVSEIIKDDHSRAELLKYLLMPSGIVYEKSIGLGEILKNRLPNFKEIEKLHIWLPQKIWNIYLILIDINTYQVGQLVLIEHPELPIEPNKLYEKTINKMSEIGFHISGEQYAEGVLDIYYLIKGTIISELRSHLYVNINERDIREMEAVVNTLVDEPKKQALKKGVPDALFKK